MSWRPRLVPLLALLVAAPAAAQDAHYWSQQYGTRSTLLGGAVIGSVNDLSATYYNPGALALIEDPDFLISANVYEASGLKVDQGAGPGEDLSSTRISAAPDLIAGLLPVGLLGARRLAYSILTRQRFDFTVAARASVAPDPGQTGGGGGEVRINQDVTDTWVGLTWSRTLDESQGFGVTGFVSVRSQKSRSEVGAQVYENGVVNSVIALENAEYSTWSVLAKVGYDRRWGNYTLGVSATTPNLRVFGSGGYYLDRAAAIDGGDQDLLLTNQEDRVATYKTPWSVGAGGSADLGDTRIHLSAEWFSSVAPYEVIELQPAVTQSTGAVYEPVFAQQFGAVLNGAIGLSHEFSDRVQGYTSFATDFSANNTDQGSETASVSRWDIYHLGVGANLVVESVDLTLGLSYAWGNSDALRIADFGVLQDGGGTSPAGTADLTYRRLRFLLGFKVNL
jgi:hypothetical protein